MNAKFTDGKLQSMKPVSGTDIVKGYLMLKSLKTDSLTFIEIDVSFALQYCKTLFV